jgi:hypothetical protein
MDQTYLIGRVEMDQRRLILSKILQADVLLYNEIYFFLVGKC